MNILVINCGSSSVKYKLISMPEREVHATGLIERIGEEKPKGHQETVRGKIDADVSAKDHQEALQSILAFLADDEKGAVSDLSEIDGFGHRVVHGGEKYSDSVVVDDQVMEGIRACSDLAPLHNPPNLIGIEAARAIAPERPQVVCFDTAFHQTIPAEAYRYALPEKLYKEEKIRRYGFHGTSHRFVARRAAELTGKDPLASRWITCHLGNGCSMAAIENGRCLDTSMGLTPLEGMVMGTRSGDLDPAILLHLGRSGWSFEDIDRLINRESGLLGLSGISNDMRELEKHAAEGSESAQLAIDVFCYRIRKYIGSFLAVLNGCDGIVFTGGIGEYGSNIRAKSTERLSELGVEIDPDRNQNIRGVEGLIGAANAKIEILVIPTDEEGEIARDAYRLLGD
ncbi:acetate/propionate family kinase [Puniceicoccus vermicola]|uniref:Acetate kinase n=1 Tax=Puniceicoccus vermicola TaxID=388746 RepID=A0A7X1AVC2_9BACT|nr:acetate kinase [Puniceicoccus vermicola]MBC2600691.1 acetate kinase [Puniceicoccus vermicola]